nr:MAG TPA: PORTAL PROTEIN [Caudoviricetes sp.]
MAFVQSAIREYKSSNSYRLAQDARLYYTGENPTINRYEKIIYDFQGRAHRDMYTANHKIASKFFGMVVDQEVSYLLGNGISFANKNTKEKLCPCFDEDMQDAAREALISGQAFVFWNLDHTQVFTAEEFVPLYDEENGALMAGIRFWQVAENKPLRATLYEIDGYTEYIKPNSSDMTIQRKKLPYKLKIQYSEVDGAEIYAGENYPGFPIVPLRNGKKAQSEIQGRRNTVDALDLASSNMVNNVDEGNLIYWVLTNCGGMDEVDDAQFVERLKTTHVAHADGDEGAKATPKSIEAPYAGTQQTIDMLTKRLYDDFQTFDSAAVSASNQTATAIKASYVPLDLKTDKFEACVTRCIKGILAVAGIDDTPTYTRNKIINAQEEMQTLLLGAAYYDDEYITKKALTLLGDADQYEGLMRRKAAEENDRIITT